MKFWGLNTMGFESCHNDPFLIAGSSLTLSYGGPVLGGPRVYLIEAGGVNKNTMFLLKNQEFSFEVELSSLPCGFNAALYFVGM
jgi:hypothetical protein